MAADAPLVIVIRSSDDVRLGQYPSSMTPAEIAEILHGLARGYEDIQRLIDRDKKLGSPARHASRDWVAMTHESHGICFCSAEGHCPGGRDCTGDRAGYCDTGSGDHDV